MIVRRLSLLLAALVGVLAPLGPGASSPAFAASSCVARAYVTNSNASPGTVSVIDVATRTGVGTVTVGSSPRSRWHPVSPGEAREVGE